MTTIVVKRQSMLTRGRRALNEAVPTWIRRLAAGPSTLVVLSRDGASVVGPRRAFRPADISLSSDLVLERRLSLPVAARKDVASAIELLVRAETPFTPQELLIDARAEPPAGSIGQLSYCVRMVPRSAVLPALARLRIPPARVRRMTVLEASAASPPFDVSLSHWHSWRTIVSVLPVPALACAALLLASTALANRQAEVEALEAAVSDRLASVRAIEAQSDALTAAQSAGAAVDQIVTAGSSSLSVALQAIREGLPETAELTRLELRNADLRLSIRSRDTLDTVRLLAAALPAWSVSVDGAITTDPAGGLESAILLVRARPS